MTITDRTNKVLAEIDAALALAEKATPEWKAHETTDPDDKEQAVYEIHDKWRTVAVINEWGTTNEAKKVNAAFIATSRTLLPAALRCLKTAIEGLLRFDDAGSVTWMWAQQSLTTLRGQWEAAQ